MGRSIKVGYRRNINLGARNREFPQRGKQRFPVFENRRAGAARKLRIPFPEKRPVGNLRRGRLFGNSSLKRRIALGALGFIVPSLLFPRLAAAREEVGAMLAGHRKPTPIVREAKARNLFRFESPEGMIRDVAELRLVELNDSKSPANERLASGCLKSVMEAEGFARKGQGGPKALAARAQGGKEKITLLGGVANLAVGTTLMNLTHEYAGHLERIERYDNLVENVKIDFRFLPNKSKITWQDSERFMALFEKNPKAANEVLLDIAVSGLESSRNFSYAMEDLAINDPARASFWATAGLFARLDFPMYTAYTYLLGEGRDPFNDLTVISKQTGVGKGFIGAAAVMDLAINWQTLRGLGKAALTGQIDPKLLAERNINVDLGPMRTSGGTPYIGAKLTGKW